MTSYPPWASVMTLLVSLHGGVAIDLSDTNGSTLPVQPAVMNLALPIPTSETPVVSNTTKQAPSVKVTPAINLIDQGQVSREQYETIKLVVDVILKPPVCFVGLVLNVIGICVLLQPQLRHGFYIYLVTLSIADSGYLICGLIRATVKIYGYFDFVAALRLESMLIPYIDKNIEIPFCKLGAYCIILFSIDRLFAVTRPLKIKDFFLSRHSKPICISLAVFIFIFYIPKAIELKTVTVFNHDANMTISVLRPIKHESGSVMSSLMTAYNTTNDVIFMYIPPLLLCIVNLLLIIQMQRIRRSRKRLFSENTKQNRSHVDKQKLVVTVFIISAFFLAVYIPLIFVRNLQKINPDYRPFHREHYIIVMFPTFVSFCWSINAAIDFTVYLATSARFRQTLKATCCKRRLRKHNLLTSPASRSWAVISINNSMSQVEETPSENECSKVRRKSKEEGTSE